MFEYEYYRTEHFRTVSWENENAADARSQNWSSKTLSTATLIIVLKGQKRPNTSLIVLCTLVFEVLMGRP